MLAEPAVVAAPLSLSRVERVDPPLRFSRLNPIDALNPRAGNRFDVPGAGVLYGATTDTGAYAETLASFRPKASMRRSVAARENDVGRVLPGQVPGEWFSSRRLRTFHVSGALPFVDIESPATHTFLTENAAKVLVQQGLENVDASHVRGPDRLLTRAIGVRSG
ncbi:RES domain-containing protein [Subtercola sp. YIM 133946]|uniref:RES domain-containing protein n=1 Tax=Subtercola sp. YIM 133946 TaxID=3118909 RepID=UPI003FCC7F09